ncbi:MAG: hypothetical protein WC262_07010 [Bacteroidales bacterium]|jgi:hypothetical protein
MVYSAPTAESLRRLGGSILRKIAYELGLIATDIAAVRAELLAAELGDVSLNSGEILLGSSENEAAAVTPSGDVTITNAGVTAIGAKKVKVAQMYSASAGKILVTQASNAVAEKTISGAISMDADGVVTLEESAINPSKLALTDTYIIVGDGSDEGAGVAVSGDATLARTGALTIGAKKVTAAKIALADGKMFVGGADGAAAEQTLTGDVTVTNAGVTAIGAKKVGKANLISESADVAGNLFVSTGSSSGIDEVAVSGDATLAADGTLTIAAEAVDYSKISLTDGSILVGDGDDIGSEAAISGDATMSNLGVLTIADSVLEASNVADVDEDNVVGGIPILFVVDVANTADDYDVTMTHKVRVVDAWIVCTGVAAHATNDTLQLKNGTNAITDALAKGDTQYATKRFTTIDETYTEIAASGTLRVTAVKDTNCAAKVFVLAVRPAAA